MRIGYPGATAEDIWGYATRTLTKTDPRSIRNITYVPMAITRYALAHLSLWEQAYADGSYTLYNLDGSTGTETSETERINKVFLGGFKKGTLLDWYVDLRCLRCYISTTIATYNFRLYAQPVVWDRATDTLKNLTPEVLVASHSESQVATAGWYNRPVNARHFEVDVNVSFDGLLGMRVRGTSWASVAATSGHGLYGLNQLASWAIMFRLRVEE